VSAHLSFFFLRDPFFLRGSLFLRGNYFWPSCTSLLDRIVVIDFRSPLTIPPLKPLRRFLSFYNCVLAFLMPSLSQSSLSREPRLKHPLNLAEMAGIDFRMSRGLKTATFRFPLHRIPPNFFLALNTHSTTAATVSPLFFQELGFFGLDPHSFLFISRFSGP